MLGVVLHAQALLIQIELVSLCWEHIREIMGARDLTCAQCGEGVRGLFQAQMESFSTLYGTVMSESTYVGHIKCRFPRVDRNFLLRFGRRKSGWSG